MKLNSELRSQARAQLHGSWMSAIGVTLVFWLLYFVASAPFGIILFIIGGPLILGYTGYFLRKARGEKAIIENLFNGFKNFFRALVLFLLSGLFICFWSLLFIIPGIIKVFSYSMAYYILIDNPGMSGLDAITASRKMMKGYKGKLFCLYLSFIGWALLCIPTFGIGYLWLFPYMQLSMANFYEDIRGGAVSVPVPVKQNTGQVPGCMVADDM